MKHKIKIVILSLVGLSITIFLVDNFIAPTRGLELSAIHSMYLKGSGYDDGAQSIIMENPKRYSDEIIDILNTAKPESDEEDMALTFVELVIEQPRVRESLAKFGNDHPNSDTRCLVQIILSDEPVLTPITDNSGKVLGYRAIESRFECKES